MADSKLFGAINSVVKQGKFGENLKLVALIPSNLHGEDHFASEVVFAEVKLQNGSSKKSVHVLIKKQQKDALIREMMTTDVQFYNEVLVYNEILPMLDKDGIVNDVFPKCIYGHATLGENYEDDIVVVNDLRKDGYRLTNEKLFIDFNHCVLALKRLAKFHALSYAKKKDNSEEFYKVIEKLREPRYIEKHRDDTNRFWSTTLLRGVETLEKETGEYKEVLEKIKKKFEYPFDMMKKICQPEEPMAVLCHGDFCRNNMVFRYDSDNNPVDVRFFDVATARYASPAIDLVFFLFMNTSSELRTERWNQLLEVYHETLSTALPPNYTVPSLDEVKKEVAERAIYGYTLCSFFIPIMLDESKIDMETISSMDPEEIEELTNTRGGEAATKIVTDIVRDLVRLNCV